MSHAAVTTADRAALRSVPIQQLPALAGARVEGPSAVQILRRMALDRLRNKELCMIPIPPTIGRPEQRTTGLDALRQLWATSTCLALAVSETDHPRRAELVDMHDRACQRVRESDLVRPYRAPTISVRGVQSQDWDDLARQIIANRRQLTNLRGAVASLLAAIHRAGGWQVADPALAGLIERAMDALETALQSSLDQPDDLPTQHREAA